MQFLKIDDKWISIKLLLSLTACWYLAQMGYYSQAQLFEPVMDRYSANEAAVGLMMSKEIFVYAITVIFMEILIYSGEVIFAIEASPQLYHQMTLNSLMVLT